MLVDLFEVILTKISKSFIIKYMEKKMILTVESTFDAAHRLMYYSGLCHNLHGHTWKLICSFSGELDPQTGMVVDFKQLKSCVQFIVDRLDHGTILNNEDGDLIEYLVSHTHKFTRIDGDPTCENLAEWLWEEIGAHIGIVFCDSDFPPELVSIQLWESPKSAVTT